MFKLLENMKLYELTRVMRNSVEFHNLVKLTMDILQKRTVFIHEKHKVKSKPKFYERLRSIFKYDVPKKKTVTNLPDPSPNIHVKLPSRQIDPYEYDKHKSRIPTFGLDEAQAVSRSFTGTGDGGLKTISQFQFAAAVKTGHKIRSKKPALFEVGDKSDFEKVISLIAIFQHRQINKSEHVVLHFDAATNEIPNIFFFH